MGRLGAALSPLLFLGAVELLRSALPTLGQGGTSMPLKSARKLTNSIASARLAVHFRTQLLFLVVILQRCYDPNWETVTRLLFFMPYPIFHDSSV